MSNNNDAYVMTALERLVGEALALGVLVSYDGDFVTIRGGVHFFTDEDSGAVLMSDGTQTIEWLQDLGEYVQTLKKRDAVFRIQITYTEGCEEGLVEYVYIPFSGVLQFSLEEAHAAMARIEEHHNWYLAESRRLRLRKETAAAPRPSWLGDDDNLLTLVSQGEEQEAYAFWTGYHENLVKAEVVLSVPLSFEP